MHTNIRGLGKYADDPIIINVTEGIKIAPRSSPNHHQTISIRLREPCKYSVHQHGKFSENQRNGVRNFIALLTSNHQGMSTCAGLSANWLFRSLL